MGMAPLSKRERLLYDVLKVHANQKEIEIFSRGNLEHSDYGEC